MWGNCLGESQLKHTAPLENLLSPCSLPASWQCDSRLSATNLIKPLLHWCWYTNNEQGVVRRKRDKKYISLPEVILEKNLHPLLILCEVQLFLSHLTPAYPILTHIRQRQYNEQILINWGSWRDFPTVLVHIDRSPMRICASAALQHNLLCSRSFNWFCLKKKYTVAPLWPLAETSLQGRTQKDSQSK